MPVYVVLVVPRLDQTGTSREDLEHRLTMEREGQLGNLARWTGGAIFANVNPGDVDVEMVHPSKSCQRYSASWVGAKPNSAKVQVVGGYITGGAVIVCP